MQYHHQLVIFRFVIIIILILNVSLLLLLMDRNAIVAYLMFDELRGGVHCIFESVGCLDGLTIYHTHIALLPIDCPVPPGESSAFGVCGWRLRRGGEETLERGGRAEAACHMEPSSLSLLRSAPKSNDLHRIGLWRP